MTEMMSEIANNWRDCFESKSKHYKKNKIVRATPFTNLFQLSDQKKQLKLKVVILYKNPLKIATKLMNYKNLFEICPNNDNPSLYSCGKDALCQNFKAYKNIIKTVNSNILHQNSKKFNLKQHLTCRNL